jgi:NAD(P)H dehydrogenase (quinone)
LIKVAIVYHSQSGHTKLQAEAVCRGAASLEGTDVLFLSAEEACERLEDLDSADAIIFGCPTYMGNVSAGMKAFQEKAVGRWFTQAWKDKIAGAFTNSSNFSGDKLNTLVGLMINAMQQGMIFVSLGVLPAQDEPGSMQTLTGPGPDAINRVDGSIGPMSTSFAVAAGEAPAKGEILTAEAYGRRIADITAQFVRGRT